MTLAPAQVVSKLLTESLLYIKGSNSYSLAA